ncbi:hypothetical protein [Streptomyces zagrosensis]|uniref:Lipoprotein n=1 Tax=Streptomyces zagrosensis TaxID=1042984 RepID=A0A7W9QEQ7_9ACTN|nr:hypothetical protein [Streptomyces zagrosensis]MBB5938619.1 hypothetical protein [Streptomyces zagrosensis]
MRRTLVLCLAPLALLSCWAATLALCVDESAKGRFPTQDVLHVVAAAGFVVCVWWFVVLLDHRSAAGFSFIVLFTWLMALLVASHKASQIYHGYVGERTEAVIVGTKHTEDRESRRARSVAVPGPGRRIIGSLRWARTAISAG